MIRKFNVKVNGKSYEVEVEELNGNISEPVTHTSQPEKPAPQPKEIPVKKVEPEKVSPAVTSSGKNVVKAPLPGVIVDINVSEGTRISKGQKLLIIEAMKMENEILSDYDGVIEKILVKKGDNVDGDQELIIIS
ncbi:biotin/lipoyl-containing protein [Marinitoga sp. 38H-ov]|uniref:biotin/lipoyl-containing protein n=1 Tax=Marinitoga sp. 38H-ov TaxID=1755814 RepID=UPI0013ED6F15|nr:biotin/lipoyl-containing protein [Marinitoga sp. 38H-ov]KAF2956098.1 hypothetical protein AS160_08015 [Marinitoga sp. 38H-ov]